MRKQRRSTCPQGLGGKSRSRSSLWERANLQPVTQVNLTSVVNVNPTDIAGRVGIGVAESLERGRRLTPLLNQLVTRRQRGLPAYRGWDAEKDECETVEALLHSATTADKRGYKVFAENARDVEIGIRRGS